MTDDAQLILAWCTGGAILMLGFAAMIHMIGKALNR